MQVLPLPNRCDRAAAQAFYPGLLEAQGDGRVTVDASEVEHIGQSMLQLLVAAATSGDGIHVSAPSDAFVNAVALAKLDDVLVMETAQ